MIALTAALLVTPRAATPTEVPLPPIDRAAQRRVAEQMHDFADDAVRVGLPFEVRAVGDAVRRFGVASTTGNANALEDIRYDLKRAVPRALEEHGQVPMLALRAVQTRMFLDAVARWRATGRVGADLTELGGNFAQKAVTNGWVDERGRLVLGTSTLATAFRVRWAQVTGLLRRHPFSPSLNAWRVYFRGRILYPDVPKGADDRTLARARVGYVKTLEKHDPDYPARLALGILDFQLGRFQPAADAFRAHLTTQPHGPWHLRARNHLTATLARLGHR